MIVCGLLGSGASVMAESDGGHCSNRTLSGDYGYAAEGVLIGIPGLPPEAPFRSVGMTHFDGNGKLTWVEHTVVNGQIIYQHGQHTGKRAGRVLRSGVN